MERREYMMQVFPKLCDAKKIAACGKYNVLPMYCEMLSDFTTPMETLRMLKDVSTVIFWNLHGPMKRGDGIHFWALTQNWN